MTSSLNVNAESHAGDLLRFLDDCPTPFHVSERAAQLLSDAGFSAVDESGAWPAGGGRHFVQRDGAIIAIVDEGAQAHAPFRLLGAHTDSPGFRLKPLADIAGAPWQQLAVEVYGGPLLNSWLDRDLGLAGRVLVRSSDGLVSPLVRIQRPMLRIPQLAIHLDREVNERGLLLDRQRHVVPVLGLGSAPELRVILANELDVDPDAIVGHDLMPFDCQPAALTGYAEEFIASARLDNLVSCHAALTGLVSSLGDRSNVRVLALFDHEEVGSTSARGANSTWLSQTVERSAIARGATRDDFLRGLGASLCVSADMAHATHPNYPERHEPGHPICMNSGPVIKVNANQRYATDAATASQFAELCADAGVPIQYFVGRNDMPCGSTIGPAAAAQLGVPTVDVGVAQLGMHSAREMCGARDPHLLTLALQTFLTAP